jgi:hypothetical protein
MDNHAIAYGGGVAIGELIGQSDDLFTNCIIASNISYYGGGLYCADNNLTLINCTLANNLAN